MRIAFLVNMEQKCLIIADDLTGGADTGAQFAERGFGTLLISLYRNPNVDLSKYIHRDVLAINTDSRQLSSDRAPSVISNVLERYEKGLFPVIFYMVLKMKGI